MKIRTSKTTAIHLHTPFRLSEGGFYHFVVCSFSIGNGGFGIYVIGFFIGFGWNE
jgi:hypothetical protein